MQFFGITLENRSEKYETLKKVITSLNIGNEEKDLYMISLDILNDTDFSIFFDKIMSQIPTNQSSVREYSIEPLTSHII